MWVALRDLFFGVSLAAFAYGSILLLVTFPSDLKELHSEWSQGHILTASFRMWRRLLKPETEHEPRSRARAQRSRRLFMRWIYSILVFVGAAAAGAAVNYLC